MDVVTTDRTDARAAAAVAEPDAGEPDVASEAGLRQQYRKQVRRFFRVVVRFENWQKRSAEKMEEKADRTAFSAVLVQSGKRFTQIDGRSRVAALSLDVFVALVPLTIIMTAYLRPLPGVHSYGDLLVRAFTLHGHSAAALDRAFGLTTQNRQAASFIA